MSTEETVPSQGGVVDGQGASTPGIEVADFVEELSSGNRRRRQEASHVIANVANSTPDELLPFVDDLVDALYRPEAQTRWEVLDALTEMSRTHADEVAGAYDGAEASLFDDGSSTVRLASFRFLARYGARSPENSEQAWPLLDEAIQCFHGDLEYRDMLVSMLEFVQGDISQAIRDELVDRIAFDAESGRGYIKTGSIEIIDAAKKASPAEGGKKAGKSKTKSKAKAKAVEKDED